MKKITCKICGLGLLQGLSKASLKKILPFIFLGVYCNSVLMGQSDTSIVQLDTSRQILSKHASIHMSGNKTAVADKTELLLTIKVDDEKKLPVENIQIDVKLYDNNNEILLKKELLTDSLGIIHFSFNRSLKQGNYKLLAYSENRQYIVSPQMHEIYVWSGNWLFVLIVGLLGGLSLFLFGMGFMSDGLQNSAGNKMREILQRLTGNRFVAMGIGALITSVIQSSSATNVMLVSFVNSHLLKFRQTIGIILGAAIGTTITAQIIAFKLTDYALIFVSVGLAFMYFSKKPQISDAGRAVFGFGVLFFGMHIMSESMEPLRDFQPFIDILVSLDNYALSIIVGAIFTAIIQSSSAFIGILIILSMQGLLSLEAAVGLIIGANIGTAITAILASINTSREARQVALAHTFIKIVGAIIAVFLIPSFIELIRFFDVGNAGSDIATARQIANAHTVYNVLLCLIFLPFTNRVAWMVNKIYPDKGADSGELTYTYLDDNLIAAPSLAIEAARNELLRMMDTVKQMVEDIIIPFFGKNTNCIESIGQKEKTVNFLRDGLNAFLIKLSRRDLSQRTTEEAFILLNATREYEQIADIVSTQLLNKAISWSRSKYKFSDEGRKELETYHQMTLKIIQNSIKVYKTFNIQKALKLKQNYYDYRQEYFELEKQHYDRLKENIEASLSSSKTHLELITILRVVSSHATNTGRILIYRYSADTDLKRKAN